jgi:hypothetical protein
VSHLFLSKLLGEWRAFMSIKAGTASLQGARAAPDMFSEVYYQ